MYKKVRTAKADHLASLGHNTTNFILSFVLPVTARPGRH